MNTHPPLPTLSDLRLHPELLSRLLFIGGESLRLYDCAEELNAEFDEDIKTLRSNIEEIIFSLLKLRLLELYLARNQFRDNPTWDLVPADKWRDILFSPTSWMPEASPGCHYEIRLTELGVQLYKELRSVRLPHTS
jgi:hypothetical protein